MGWILLAIILGSLFYCGKIVVEFSNRTLVLQPAILHEKERSLELDELACAEE